jgi:hypothetical protein
MQVIKIDPGQPPEEIGIADRYELEAMAGQPCASVSLDNGITVIVPQYDEMQDLAPCCWMHVQPFEQLLYGSVYIVRAGICGPVSVREGDLDYVKSHFRAVRDYD